MRLFRRDRPGHSFEWLGRYRVWMIWTERKEEYYMLEMIGKLLGVLEKAEDAYLLGAGRKYIELIRKDRLELMQEQAKGYDSDDGKIGSILKRLKINTEALNAEMDRYRATASK